MNRRICVLLFATSLVACSVSLTVAQAAKGSRAKQDSASDTVVAQDAQESETKPLKLADGKLKMAFPATWKQVQPRSSMLEAEFKIPAIDAAAENGRLTIMRAGGSIEANIQRREEQFSQADGSATDAKTVVEDIAGCTVNLVDISGTFSDSMGGGPFSGGKKVQRPDYRMLAAIIETKSLGNYFVKFYGPKATLDKNAKGFKQMIRGLSIE